MTVVYAGSAMPATGTGYNTGVSRRYSDMLELVRSHPALASAMVYAAAIALMGRDVLGSVGSSIAGDLGDPVLNAAILAWNARTIPWTDAWFDFPGFHPVRDGLTFSEHLLGVSVVATPLYWMTGDAAVTYNLTLLLTYVLCGLAMYALVLRLTRHAGASFLAGLAYGFAPYRAWQVVHLQVLAVFWAPLALLGLHAYLETGRRRWLAVFGGGWLLQGLANGYFLVFFSVLVALWVLWFVVAQRRWRDLAAIAAAALVASIPLVPILSRYAAVHARLGLSRTPEDVLAGSADISAVLCASPQLLAWGWLQAGVCGGEQQLFPGAALVALCGLGLCRARRAAPLLAASRQRAVSAFYGLAALVLWALSWGPAPMLNGRPVPGWGPYGWLMLVPGMTTLRVPARFWMMAVLCLCVAMGTLLAGLLARRPVRSSRWLIAVAGGALLLDGWGALPAAALPPGVPRPDAVRGGVVLTLPLGDNVDIDAAAQLGAASGGWRSVNGYSGYQPPLYRLVRDAAHDLDLQLLQPFLRRGDLHVIIVERSDRHVGMIEQHPDARLIARANGRRQYRIPAQPASRRLPAGERLSIAAITASCSPGHMSLLQDGDAATRWECGPQTPGQELTLDLGRVVTAATIVPALGAFANDFPRRLRVETSVNGTDWEQAWEGDMLAEAVEAELWEPGTGRLVVSFRPRQARYARLRLMSRDDVWYWSVAEIEIWSAAQDEGITQSQS